MDCFGTYFTHVQKALSWTWQPAHMEHTKYTAVRAKVYIQQNHSACTDEALRRVYRWGPWPRVQTRPLPLRPWPEPSACTCDPGPEPSACTCDPRKRVHSRPPDPPGNTQHIPPTGNLGKSSTQKHGYGWGYVIVCRRGHVTVTWGKFALWRDMDINQGMGGMGIKHLFGWWTQFLLSFTPIWGNDPIWLAHSFQMGWWKTTISYNHIPKIHLRRSHMDPTGNPNIHLFAHFRWGERYHDLLSLFEFLDNGAAWLWKTRKLRIFFKSWRVGEPLGMFRCMSTTEDTHGTPKKWRVGSDDVPDFNWVIFVGSICEFSSSCMLLFFGGEGMNFKHHQHHHYSYYYLPSYDNRLQQKMSFFH